MTDEHLPDLLSDYALGLLPSEARRRVERHTGQCAACRAALARERALAAAVRGAIHAAAAPPPGRLASLRPQPAAHPRTAPLYARLAPVTLITMLVALGLLFGRGATPFASPVYAEGTPTLTATNTHTPTVTPAGAPTATEVAAALPPATATPAP